MRLGLGEVFGTLGAVPTFVDPLLVGLLAWWPMTPSDLSDGTVADYTGNVSLAANGGVSTQIAGPVSTRPGAFVFDGSSGYLSAASQTSFNFGTGDFSVAFWLYPGSPWGSGTIGVIGQKLDDTTNGWQIYQDSGHTSLLDARLTQQNSFLNGTELTTGSWWHCAFTRASGAVTWYINASVDATGTNSDSVSDDSAAFQIANAQTWVSSWYGGAMADVRLYSRALTAGDVALLYAGDY